MNSRKKTFILTAVISVLLTVLVAGQDGSKKIMDVCIYENWKRLTDIRISNDGKWAAYNVRPNRGDGKLYLVNLEDGTEKVFDRGSSPRFSPESDYLVYRIKPQYQVTRQAKLDKKKPDMMPKDSLGIYRIDQDLLSKVPRVEDFRVPDRASSWMVIKHYFKKDTAAVDTNEAGVRLAKPEGKPAKLVVINPAENKKYEFEEVYNFFIAEEGTAVLFTRFHRMDDTIAGRSVVRLDTKTGKSAEVFSTRGSFGKLIVDRPGSQFAFLHHPDSGRFDAMNLYYLSGKETKAISVVDTLTEGMPEDWGISNNGGLWFSGDGSKLYFGTAPKPEPEPEDTLLEEEKYRLDVWNWQDPLLQPMQKLRLENEKKRTYRAVWHVNQGKMVQLADKEMESVNTLHKGNGEIALGSSRKPYEKLISWETHRYSDYYLVDLNTGKRELVLKKKASTARLSPDGDYLVWYEYDDSNYYSHNVRTSELVCISCNVKDPFYDVKHDEPSLPYPTRIQGFTEDGESVLVGSTYDIWKMDLAGKALPVNLTGGIGEKKQISFRYVHLEYDNPGIPLKKEIYLNGISDITKEQGIYSASALLNMEPRILQEGKFSFQLVGRARNADVLLWRKGDFDEYTDLYSSNGKFKDIRRISDANPQGKDYYWGTPRLVHWTSYNGDELDGILLVPENFDPSKKYPMLVYFYERSSTRLYRHFVPRPSASTIDWALCASNGYVVFVPDIVYRDGYPGQSAYDAIVSGSLAMCEQFDFIDKKRMGLQGQSWGGYQVAWLITRTKLFAAAMAGAPVSNMTSAYGGIRWGSGMSRMFQYEESQSRIGGTLWEKTGLYLENSPLFKVPDIETPLLMMHNDNDGAVPWYQGIEMFVAMRRLDKPVWMLVYNNEAHNLRRWPNKVDLSIRMMQFFDHYLKDAPAPEWMEEGIPAIDKGSNDAYKLMK